MFSLPVHSTVKFLWLLLCFYNTTITLICLFSSFLSRHSTLTYFKTFSPILLLPLFSLNSSSSSFLPLVLIPRDQLITLKKKKSFKWLDHQLSSKKVHVTYLTIRSSELAFLNNLGPEQAAHCYIIMPTKTNSKKTSSEQLQVFSVI